MLVRDRSALARLMTLVENRAPELPAIMSRVYGRTGHAHVVGVTGPPGAGKSTLTDRLTAHLRAAERRIGIVAVDPSSPFSGGAVLGDRIRMQAHFLDPGVFIRSLASRGSHGGVARATRDVIRRFDAFGMDRILVETVGVGQTELDVMRLADTTVVVLVPEAGDAVQVMKAGLLEIADIFLVNKADRDGAERMRSELAQMLHLRPAAAWSIPVLLTQAATDGGTAAVLDALEQHRAFLAADPERARRARRHRPPARPTRPQGAHHHLPARQPRGHVPRLPRTRRTVGRVVDDERRPGDAAELRGAPRPRRPTRGGVLPEGPPRLPRGAAALVRRRPLPPRARGHPSRAPARAADPGGLLLDPRGVHPEPARPPIHGRVRPHPAARYPARPALQDRHRYGVRVWRAPHGHRAHRVRGVPGGAGRTAGPAAPTRRHGGARTAPTLISPRVPTIVAGLG